jgi:hypothetical protein
MDSLAPRNKEKVEGNAEWVSLMKYEEEREDHYCDYPLVKKD